ncbi:MAG: acetyl-CoA carboxylase biotin carboxyl carrier protein subunit [Anaerolineae bacterium]|jgi:biotin carboxyl carrier protein
MKYKVRVEDRTFEVEVGDLAVRPIVATIDGARFEVWPEREEAAPAPPSAEPAAAASPSRPPAAPAPPRRTRRAADEDSLRPARAGNAVYAPIPGIIEAVAVRPGDRVTAGQELCVLEAMTMKNVIRAPRAGQVADVCVAVGDRVKHNDILFQVAAIPGNGGK